MEKPMIDHINANLPQLAARTKDETNWYTHLLEHNFFSKSAWETIMNTQHNTESRVREIYLHCTKTPQFDLLIKTLKDCGNHDSAKILEDYYETSSSASRGISKRSLIWFDIKCGTKHYSGREEDLDTIHKYWLEAYREKSLTFVGITGLGGIGKSELATNYAQKFHNEVQGHCIWINAETNLSFSESFHRLAKRLGVSLLDEFGKEKNLEFLTSTVYERLSNEKCLVVFDNLESYEEYFLECFVKYARKLAPSSIKPFVLLTSRYQLVKKDFGTLAKQINLSVLSESSAVSFFQDALDITCENEDLVSNLKTLCGQLGNFPLAMQQAAANIDATSQYCDVARAVKDYSESFERKCKNFLQYKLSMYSTNENVDKTTYLTWQITLEKLKLMPGVGSKANLALDVMSFFNAENIPASFLADILNFFDGHGSTQNIMSNTPKAASPSLPNLGYNYDCEAKFELHYVQKPVDIFKILADYSMCKINQIENDSCISVHRLVQVVSQINLHKERRWIKLFNTLLQTVNELFENDIISFGYVTQIISLLNHTKQNTKIVSDHQTYRNLLFQIKHLYSEQGKYRDGLIYTSFATRQMKELFGNENKNTMRMTVSHGYFLMESGELKVAQNLLEHVYQRQLNMSFTCNEIERRCFEDDLLYTKQAVASVYYQLGKYDEALNMFLEVLEVQHRVIGIEHPDTLSIKHNIAGIYELQGKYDEALEIFLELLPVTQRVIGTEHRDTLTTKHNLANLYNRKGKYDEALKIYLEVLETRQRILGTEHSYTLSTKKTVANTYTSKGNYDEALEMYLEVLEVEQREMGMEHPNTLNTKHNIADIYSKKGNHGEALRMFLEVLEALQRVLGMEHPYTINTQHSIATMYNQIGKYEESMKMFSELLHVQKRVIGTEHSDTLITKSNVGYYYYRKGDYDEALKIVLEVLEVQERVIGKEHRRTLATKHNVAALYSSKGDYDQALKMYLEVLKVQQRVIGMEHPHTLATKHDVASVYSKNVHYYEALKMFFEVLDIQSRVLGMEHPDTLTTKHSIAFVYESQRKYEEALAMFLEVFEASQRVLGMDHPNTLVTKRNIASTYNKKGNNEEALKIFLEVLETEQRVLGMEHPNTLATKDFVEHLVNKKKTKCHVL